MAFPAKGKPRQRHDWTILGVGIGDNSQLVEHLWGKPCCYQRERLLSYEVWQYPRKEVRFVNGQVIGVIGESVNYRGNKVITTKCRYSDLLQVVGEPDTKSNFGNGVLLRYRKMNLGVNLDRRGLVKRVFLEWEGRPSR